VRTFLRQSKFDDLYLKNQREIKIQSAEEGKTRYMNELRALIYGDDKTKGVDQSRLPEAMRITPEMIGAKVLAEYQQVLDDPLGLKAPIISDPKVDAELGWARAVAATNYLSRVTGLIASVLKTKDLTGIVDPDTLELREANFAPTDDKRVELEKVLKEIRDQVVNNVSHLNNDDCEKLRDEVVKCVAELQTAALQYRAQDTVVEMFASKQALLVYKLSSAGCFGGEQQKAILDYLHALCKEYPEKSLVELEGLIQRKVMSATTRVNDCSAQAVKTLASSSIIPDVKNERVRALLDRVFVSCLTETSDKAPDVDEIVAAMRERYDASENELEKVLKTNPCKGWPFPSDGAGSWLTGYPAEKVAALKALFARSELNRRKHEFGSSLDPADILKAAEGKFANAVEDIKWIINDIRGKANAEAIGQRGFLSSLKLRVSGYSKEISEKFEAKIQEALNAYANNPEAYRNQHFIEAMVK